MGSSSTARRLRAHRCLLCCHPEELRLIHKLYDHNYWSKLKCSSNIKLKAFHNKKSFLIPVSKAKWDEETNTDYNHLTQEGAIFFIFQQKRSNIIKYKSHIFTPNLTKFCFPQPQWTKDWSSLPRWKCWARISAEKPPFTTVPTHEFNTSVFP